MSDYSVLKNDHLAVDLDIAVFLAEAAQAAYGRIGPDDPSSDDDVDTPPRWAAKAGFGAANTFNHRNVQGFWCVNDGVALLAFRGTSSPRQWMRDARFFPAPYPWGRLHVGFRDGVEAQTAELQLFLNAAAVAKAPYLWVIGHSLGGALAVIAASKLKLLKQDVVPPPGLHLRPAPGRAPRFRRSVRGGIPGSARALHQPGRHRAPRSH